MAIKKYDSYWEVIDAAYKEMRGPGHYNINQDFCLHGSANRAKNAGGTLMQNLNKKSQPGMFVKKKSIG